MKNLFSNKWAWAVLVLILINIATIGAMWCSMYGRNGHHRGDGFHNKEERGERGSDHKGGKGGDFLTRELNLTPAQQASFEELRTAHFKNLETNFAEMKALKKEVVQNLGKSEADVEPVFQKIGALEIAIQKETFDHFNKMYALCTDSQKVKLKEKLSNIMEHRGKGFGRPGFGGGSGADGNRGHGQKHGGNRGACVQGTCSHNHTSADSAKSNQ